MSRGTWIAVLLLVATNAVWCVAWLGRAGLEAEPEVVALDAWTSDAETARATPGGAGRSQDAAALTRDDEAAAGLVLPGHEEPGLTLGGQGTPEAGTPDTTGEGPPEAVAAGERRRAALQRMRTTLRKIAQVKDAALRREGIEELTAALSATESPDAEYALGTLYSLSGLGLDLDLGTFRELVLAQVDAEAPTVRRYALYALRVTGLDGADFRLAIDAASDPDPDVRSHGTRILNAYTKGKLTGEAADAVLRLLEDEHPRVRKGALRGFWGAEVTPELEQALLDLAARPEDRHDVIQNALSPLPNKSRAVVDALFEHLGDDDRRIRQRSHWGLQRGVSKELKPYVARRYAAHLQEFLNPKTQREALQLIARFGDASLVPQLERFAENQLVNGKVRETALKAAAYLTREKPAR